MDLGIAKGSLGQRWECWDGRLALALSEEGADVFISARGEERLIRACEEISCKTGNKVTPIVADHSTDEGRELILTVCPKPDILVGTCSPPPYTGDYRIIENADWVANLEITPSHSIYEGASGNG